MTHKIVERQTFKDGDGFQFVCICGNTPDDYGFYAVDENDNQIDVPDYDTPGTMMKCDKCKRVFDCVTGEVRC